MKIDRHIKGWWTAYRYESASTLTQTTSESELPDQNHTTSKKIESVRN